MTTEYAEVEFKKDMIEFLVEEGYTEMLSHGTEYGKAFDYPNNYWLEPLKEDDARLDFSVFVDYLNPIKSSEVIDMADGVDDIRFLIRLPDEVWEKYKATRS